jgi:hypothetical protein
MKNNKELDIDDNTFLYLSLLLTHPNKYLPKHYTKKQLLQMPQKEYRELIEESISILLMNGLVKLTED